jgi:hypothetical protein
VAAAPHRVTRRPRTAVVKPPASAPRRDRRTTAAVAVLVAAGLVLRLAAARGDLWFDEVWSLVHVRDLHGPLGVFTAIHHDNNHHLNSLWLWLLGPHASALAARLLAVATGSAAVVLVWVAGRRYGDTAGLVAAALAAVAHPLVLYSSEARGYGPALLASLATFVCLDGWFRTRRASWLGGFWLAAAAGMLSQLTYVQVWTAAVVWSLHHAWTAAARWRGVALDVLLAHAVPAAVLGVLWVVDVGHMQGGGAPVNETPAVVRGAFAAALGAPDAEPVRTLATVLVLGLGVLGVVRLARLGRYDWPFFAAVLFVTPPLLVLTRGGTHMFFRYFLVCFPFLYLLLGVLAAWGLRQAGAARIATAVALALLLLAHAGQTATLVAVGRGRYCDAIRFMAASSPAGPVTVGSDHDFRNRLLVEYHARCAPPDRDVRYVSLGTGPQWMITHARERAFDPPPVMGTRRGLRYEFRRSYPFAGVSGWSWHVYRRAAS